MVLPCVLCVCVPSTFMLMDLGANFDLPANKKQSVNQLLSEVTPTVAMMQGFCLQVLRNGAGEVAEVHYLPLEWVKKTPDGDLVLIKTWH